MTPSAAKTRCPRIGQVLLGLFLLGLSCSRPVSPNLLLIVVDTLRADHLSAYGYPWDTSPNLEHLASQGVLFEDCTAQSSWTIPSMISLMTGENLFHTTWKIPETMPVFAEAFSANNYRTGAIVGNSVLAADAGFDRGFETYSVRQKGGKMWSAEDIESQTLSFFDSSDSRPWMLWAHFMDTHFPYAPPGEYREWTRDATALFDTQQMGLINSAITAQPQGKQTLLRQQVSYLEQDVDLYDGEIRRVDAAIGRIMKGLEARGLLETTIIAVLADHGEGLYQRTQHPDRFAQIADAKRSKGNPLILPDYLQREHGYWLYEELIHTPLIISGPGVTAGKRVEALVSNLDGIATLSSLCGISPSGDRGRDLSPWIAGRGKVPDAPFVFSACGEAWAVKVPRGGKAILPTDKGGRWGQAPQYYDLRQDPGEHQPRHDDGQNGRLFQNLKVAAEEDPFLSWSQAADPDTLERLRELGYVR